MRVCDIESNQIEEQKEMELKCFPFTIETLSSICFNFNKMMILQNHIVMWQRKIKTFFRSNMWFWGLFQVGNRLKWRNANTKRDIIEMSFLYWLKQKKIHRSENGNKLSVLVCSNDMNELWKWKFRSVMLLELFIKCYW